MRTRQNRQEHPASELDLPLESLVEQHFGPPDPRPVLERLGPLPPGAASLTLPLWAFEPAWRVVTGLRVNPGEARAVVVFGVQREGRRVLVGQARLTESLLFLGSRELADSRRDHPLLGGRRQ